MRIKNGASIRGLRPELAIALIVVNETMREYNLRPTLTEGTAGSHMSGSLHYVGLAVDFRSRELTAEQRLVFRAELQKDLGDEFEVIEEKDHFHIEYSPKKQVNGAT